jgi:integrase
MACLYKRRESPYFWLKFRDDRGIMRQVSTRCRHNVAPEVRRARQMQAEKTVIELNNGFVTETGNGWAWAADYIKSRYSPSPLTLERYLCAWANLTVYLDDQRIESPNHLQREHCFAYIAWRQIEDKPKGRYRGRHNTALTELKALRIVMDEAVNRGIVTANPCLRLGVKKERSKEKPELTAGDCLAIRAGIEAITEPLRREMLANSFEIARFQGCRLSETKLNPLSDVDLQTGTIRFRSAKGGKDFTTRLHPALVPLFEKLRADGKSSTWNQPTNVRSRQWASTTWWKFLDRLGLKAKGITFHSTRVTVVTELARNDVHESKAQAYVGHASTTVHRIYQRLRPQDLTDCVSAVGGSASSDAPSAT